MWRFCAGFDVFPWPVAVAARGAIALSQFTP